MSDEDEQNQGLREAHTLAENAAAAALDEARAAKIGATRALTEAAMMDLAAQRAGGDEPEQQSLLLDEMDEQYALFAGPVAHVARQVSAARSGPGRPKGSKNKATEKFRDTLMRMGYRHPGLNLAGLANADPLALALEWLGIDCGDKPAALVLVDAMADGRVKRAELAHWMQQASGLILKANAELMPYFESKAPVQVDLKKTQLGLMLIGDLRAAPPADDDGVISLTNVAQPE